MAINLSKILFDVDSIAREYRNNSEADEVIAISHSKIYRRPRHSAIELTSLATKWILIRITLIKNVKREAKWQILTFRWYWGVFYLTTDHFLSLEVALHEHDQMILEHIVVLMLLHKSFSMLFFLYKSHLRLSVSSLQ